MAKTDVLVAYSFTTTLKFPELLNRLNNDGPWRWMGRDSDHYGDYISCLGGPDASRLKVFQEGDKYVLNIRYKSDAPNAAVEWEALHRQLLEQVLPSVGARDVRATEGYS